MKSFSQYILRKIEEQDVDLDTDLNGSNPMDKPQIGMNKPKNDLEQSPDDALKKLIKLAWDRHKDEAKAFFTRLGATDPQIKSALEEINDGSDDHSTPVNNSVDTNSDDVVPPESDSGAGIESESE